VRTNPLVAINEWVVLYQAEPKAGGFFMDCGKCFLAAEA